VSVPQLTAFIQGQDVVSADQLNTYEQVCQNTTQLRAFIGLPGMQVALQGINIPNDGGGGEFYWNSTALGPDDNSTVIVPQPGVPGAWVRLTLTENNVTVVPNIAALRALLGGPVAVAVWVEGYYTPGDGGGGAYTYIPTDLSSADNGGTIIIDAQNHRYYSNWHGTGLVTDKLFGAHVNGVTDDGPYIQNAINSLTSTGGKVTLVAGTRLINTGLVIGVGGITIEGVGWANSNINRSSPNGPPTTGSIIYTTEVTASVFTITANGMHVTIRNVAFIQNQPADVVGWTPTVYPATIYVPGVAVSNYGPDTLFENLLFWNCYVGIQLGNSVSGLLSGNSTMRHIWGSPISQGLAIQCAAGVVTEDIHFSAGFNSNASLGINPWILLNGTAVYCAQATAAHFNDLTVGGYSVGILFTTNTQGAAQGFAIANMRFGAGGTALLFTGAGPFSGGVVNFYYVGIYPYNGNLVYPIVAEFGASLDVDFANVYIYQCPDSAVILEGEADLGFTNLRVFGYDTDGSGNPALNAIAGNTITVSGRLLTLFGGGPQTGGGGTFNISHAN
jgi:hypothetical protein